MEELAFYAVRKNNLDKLKTLLENGTISATIIEHWNIVGFGEMTLADWATEMKNLEILDYLLKKEPSLLVKRRKSAYSLLDHAVHSRSLDVVKYLVEEYNADIFEERLYYYNSGYKRSNPIFKAAEDGRLEIFKYLIMKGNVDVNAPFKLREDHHYPKSLLFIADSDSYERKDSPSVLEYLLKETNIDVSVVDDYGDNILFQYKICDNKPLLKFILDKHKEKFDLNEKNSKWKTFLHHYIEENSDDAKFIQYLVEEKGANINITDDKFKWTPLHFAAAAGHSSICRYLINRGANIEAADADGDTLLHLGAIGGYIDICKIMIEHGSSINQKNRKGDSPLHYVISGYYEKFNGVTILSRHSNRKRRNPLQVFVYFINQGANITQKNYEGKTAIDFLILKGNLKGLKYLIRHGIIDINQENEYRESLVHLAATYNQIPILDYLVRIKKADINTYRRKRTGFGWNSQTPLHTALRLGHYESSKYLIKHGAQLPSVFERGVEESKLIVRIQYELHTGRARRNVAPHAFSTLFQNQNFNYSRAVLEGTNHSIRSAPAHPFCSMITHYAFQFQGFLTLAHLLVSYIRGPYYEPSDPLVSQIGSENIAIEDAINTLPDFKDIN